MATRKKKTTTSPTMPTLPKAPAAPPGLGVCVRRDRAKSLRADARTAGAKSPMFPKGGSAFACWCAERGIHTLDKRPIEEWNALLEEFASRPVHGLRRGHDGGDHRPNSRTRR